MKRNAEYLTIPAGRRSLHTVLCIALLVGQVSAADQSTRIETDRQPTLVRKPSIAVGRADAPNQSSSRRRRSHSERALAAPASHPNQANTRAQSVPRGRSAFDTSGVIQASAVSAVDNDLRSPSASATAEPSWTTRSNAQPTNRLRHSATTDSPIGKIEAAVDGNTNGRSTDQSMPALRPAGDLPIINAASQPETRPSSASLGVSAADSVTKVELPRNADESDTAPPSEKSPSDSDEPINWTVTDQEVEEARCVIRLFGTLGVQPPNATSPIKEASPTEAVSMATPKPTLARKSEFIVTDESRESRATSETTATTETMVPAEPTTEWKQPENENGLTASANGQPKPVATDLTTEFIPVEVPSGETMNLLRGPATDYSLRDRDDSLRDRFEPAEEAAAEVDPPAATLEMAIPVEPSLAGPETSPRRTSSFQPTFVIGDRELPSSESPATDPLSENSHRSGGHQENYGTDDDRASWVPSQVGGGESTTQSNDLERAESSSTPEAEPKAALESLTEQRDFAAEDLQAASVPAGPVAAESAAVASDGKAEHSGRAVRHRLKAAINKFVRSETTADPTPGTSTKSGEEAARLIGLPEAVETSVPENDAAELLAEDPDLVSRDSQESSEPEQSIHPDVNVAKLPETSVALPTSETATEQTPVTGTWAEPSAAKPSERAAPSVSRGEFYRIRSDAPPQRPLDVGSLAGDRVGPQVVDSQRRGNSGQQHQPPRKLPLRVTEIRTSMVPPPAREVPTQEAQPQRMPEVRLAVRTSYPLQAPGRVTLATVVDRSVCEVVQHSPYEVALVGKHEGQTDVAIWLEGGRSAQVYRVVVGRGDVAAQDQGKLERLLAELFPRSRVSVTQHEGSVRVDGVAKNRQEAIQILSVVRSVKLIPVVDNLRLRQR